MGQVSESIRDSFTLNRTVIISLAVKFAVFIIGIAIIGIFSTRTELAACGSTVSGGPSMYYSPYADLEAYTDYRDLYLRCLVTPFLNGSQAYSLPIVYNYPPLFLYVLSAFAIINLIWVPAIPLVLLDALTVIPIYLIVKNYLSKGNSKLAFAVCLAWVVNPLNLFYNDLMWLNPGPTTFFLITSVYFLLRGNYVFSSILLAISTGFKQTSVLLFPIFILFSLKFKGFTKELMYYILIYAGLLFLISLPYIYLNPQQYLWALQLPILGNPPGTGSGTPTAFVYDLSQPVRLTTFLGLIKFIDLKGLAVASYSFLNYAVIAAYAGIIVYMLVTRRKPTANDLLIYCLAALLVFDSFFGRGVYKYYFAALTPLAIPFLSSRRGLIIFQIFSVALILLPRVVSPWMAVLLITFLPSLMYRDQAADESTTGLNDIAIHSESD
ncbi:MAG: hypothetical protein ACYC7D_15590 [Nitrososphaerales archaeon]